MAVYSAGLQNVWIFPLDEDGYPRTEDAVTYEGMRALGGQVFNLSIPEPRRITHYGDNAVLAVQYLPPQEGVTAELRIAANDHDLNAYLTGVISRAVGDTATAIALGTDRQGFEPTVAIVVTQPAVDVDTGASCWRTLVIPRARVIPAPPSMNADAATVLYRCALSPSPLHLWHEALSIDDDGATRATALEIHSENCVKFVTFLGDNTTREFPLSSDYPVADADSVMAWVEGVEASVSVDVEENTITFEAAPVAGARCVCKYEYA